MRVWPYVAWPGAGWEPPPVDVARAFLAECGAAGCDVELTLLTDDDPARLDWANLFVAGLAQEPVPPNLVVEIGNEPTTHKTILTRNLQDACEVLGAPYSSGDYEDSFRFFGTYLTAHTPRDAEWPRKAHDLLEYHNGGGPNSPSDPAHAVPCVADEPIRPDQAGFAAADFYAYAAACSLLGAGATFHCESGKQALPPTPDEAACAAAFARGLSIFPPHAPLGAYRRVEGDATLRTYVVGGWMVRIRPTTPGPPEPGWTPLDPAGICWRQP